MDEKEMIYLYRSEQLPYIRELINNEYQGMLNQYTSKITRNQYQNTGLEFEDYLSTNYLSVIEALKTFNIKQCKYSFAQALAIINRQHVLKYVRVNSSVGNHALNHSVSLDNLKAIDNSILVQDQNANIEDKLRNENLYEKIIEELCGKRKTPKKIIKLRAEGYSFKEISSKLHVNVKRVVAIFNCIKKRFQQKKLYI